MKRLNNFVDADTIDTPTADIPDGGFRNETTPAAPATPVMAEMVQSHYYSFRRFVYEAGLTFDGNIDTYTSSQYWDAYLANTREIMLKGIGLSALIPSIDSGKTRALSSMPDFLRASGASLEFTVLGNTTNLKMAVGNVPFSVDSDILKSGITAAPGTNNTAQIVSTISNDLYAGEDGDTLVIGSTGSEISSLVGQIIAFKTPAGEIFRGFLKNAAEIVDCFRGYYFDDNGDPIVRRGLSTSDVITLMKIGWVFANNNGTTFDVSYRTPVESYNEPFAPVTNDYWYDITNKTWKKYNGASWDVSDSVLIGEIVSDDTNTIASRSNDFYKSFNELNNIELDIFTTEVIRSKQTRGRISVYGIEIQVDHIFSAWDILNDLESPLVESADTVYYLYISDNGMPVISEEKPYYRKDLKGEYHPYHSWRFVGMAFNDSGSDFTLIYDENSTYSKKAFITTNFTTTSATYVDVPNLSIDILSRKNKIVDVTLNSADLSNALTCATAGGGNVGINYDGTIVAVEGHYGNAASWHSGIDCSRPVELKEGVNSFKVQMKRENATTIGIDDSTLTVIKK